MTFFLSSSVFLRLFVSSKNQILKYLYYYMSGMLICAFFMYLGFPLKGELMLMDHRFVLIPISYALPMMPLFAIIDYCCSSKRNGVLIASMLNTVLFTWVFISTNAMYILL